MGKRLFIMRHAKSKWSEQGVSDHDRALAKRGKRDAADMGRALAERGLQPQLILCSTAKRARATVKRLLASAEATPQVRYSRALYGAGPLDCVRLLRHVPDEIHTVMLVGHNPGLEELATLLSRRQVTLATAHLLCLELDVAAWADLDANTGARLTLSLRPLDLRAPGTK